VIPAAMVFACSISDSTKRRFELPAAASGQLTLQIDAAALAALLAGAPRAVRARVKSRRVAAVLA